jgi:D-sedoheptulose 7-phosphate isomerase
MTGAGTCVTEVPMSGAHHHMRETITEAFRQSIEVKQRAADQMLDDIVRAAEMMIQTLRAGGKIAFCGNGGSAADAQHLAGELVGRFRRERPALAAIALTTDTSILTAIGNDYGFERVYERQVEALLRPGDLLIAISTSGEAENVDKAVERALEIGVRCIGMTGASGGKLANGVELCLKVPSEETPRVQETHITIGHILCDLVEAEFTP